jgi:asparagine synthase (glutamine-hydrolysing)
MEFLIIPDNETAGQVLDHGAAPQVIRHASGRPWLAGRWAEHEMLEVESGRRRLAIAGCAPATPAGAAVAERELARARSLGDLAQLTSLLPGSFHLLASFDGHTRSQGAISTSRQIFYAQTGGITVASDRPAALTRTIGARLDEEALALRLLTPMVPWPLSTRPVWRGVSELPVGCWLHVGPDGAGRAIRWWSPPRAEVPLAEAAGAVREALRDAIAARASQRDVISADLSGGLDSASLCFLAAGTGARLLTYHWRPLDPANDDTRWAELAAGYLPGAHHRFIGADDTPAWFGTHDGPAGTEDPAGPGAPEDLEGPLAWNRNRRHMEHLTRLDAAEGSGFHLTGLGGDELFGALPGYLWSLFRSHPLASARIVNRYRLVNRWSLCSTARGLLDRESFARSLARTAETVTAPPLGRSEAQLGWRGPVRVPAWVTEGTVARVRDLLRQAADAGPVPLDDDRAQHQLLESAVSSGATVRQLRSASSRQGVEWDAPFLDDRVLHAALSVLIQDRIAPGSYKPVLAAAMRGVVPDAILGRRSKGEYSAEAFDGLRRNRQALRGLCDDLQLERLGLVSAGALRDALTRPGPEARDVNLLENTLACEAWLRTVTTVPSGGT